MKVIKAIILLSICFLNSSAKEHPSQYHKFIDSAELNIVNNSLEEAYLCYNKAFRLKSSSFAQDLYNAILCAIKLKKIEGALQLCWKLADKGVGRAFFEKSSIFTALKKSSQWDGILSRSQCVKDSLSKKYADVNQKLLELHNIDQQIHSIWAKSDHNAKLWDEVKDKDDSISIELMKIFKRHGYLSEFTIGTYIEEDTILADPVFLVIMLHNYQGRIGRNDTLFSPILHHELQAGNIKPDFIAKILDGGSNSGDRSYYGSLQLYWIYNCKLYIRKYTDKKYLKEIEANRKMIGLYPLNDFIKKMKFNAEGYNKGFLIYAFASEVNSFSDKDVESNFLSGLIEIDSISNCKTR